MSRQFRTLVLFSLYRFFGRYVMTDHQKFQDKIWPKPHITVSQFRFASLKFDHNRHLPIIAKARAEVDIEGLRDVDGVLNGDKDGPNLGGWVKTLATFLNLEKQEFIWNVQIFLTLFWDFTMFRFCQCHLYWYIIVSPLLVYHSRRVGWASWATSPDCFSNPFENWFIRDDLTFLRGVFGLNGRMHTNETL